MNRMEYSIAKSLNENVEFYDVPFPHLSSQPALDQVNPGIGQIVSLYETIVPMRGSSHYTIEKKIEPTVTVTETEKINSSQDLITSQVGSGESPLDPAILASFQHPIITDSIIFPKEEKIAAKRKNETKLSETKPQKVKKIDHKFLTKRVWSHEL